MVTFLLYFLLPLLGFLAAISILVIIFKVYDYKNRQALYNHQILPNQLAGRDKEIRRLAQQQILTGQSGAVIGAFGNERTAILDALRNPELYGDDADRFIFSTLDISALVKECSQTQFWEYALEPLQEKFANDTDSPLFKAYESCQNNDFKNRYLEKLIAQMKQEGWRLVLMLDRFEVLLHRPQLKSEEFFGGLRVLASSHHPSSLCVMIASNEPVWQLNEDTKCFNFGSPYLNFLEMGAVTLGTISDKEIDELLNNNIGHSFTDDDKYFLKDVSGNHPYLLQVVTVILIQAYRDKEENPLETTRIIFFDKAEEMLTNIFKFWSPKLCETFISVAQEFDISSFKREIKELNRQGFLRQENDKWQICSSSFAEFVKDKTVQELCQQKQNYGKT